MFGEGTAGAIGGEGGQWSVVICKSKSLYPAFRESEAEDRAGMAPMFGGPFFEVLESLWKGRYSRPGGHGLVFTGRRIPQSDLNQANLGLFIGAIRQK